MFFSVITPCLNQVAFLGETLDSVRVAAGHAPDDRVEHLVIDGGSTDGCIALLGAQTSARWTSGPDAGQADAINRGLSLARGDVVSYLCADDLLEPDALARVSDAFRENPEADAVYGDGYFLEGDSGWKRLKRAGADAPQKLAAGNRFIQPSVFLRSRVIGRYGPFDAGLQFCMDHEYWLRIAGGVRWVYVPEPLATSRLHVGAKTSRYLARAWDEAATMQGRYGHGIRPRLEALWMRFCGCYYYTAKRAAFRLLGHLRKGAR